MKRNLSLILVFLLISVFGQEAIRENAVVKVVQRVSPSVVSISSRQRVQNPFFFGDFWNLFGFGDEPDFKGPSREEQSLGSGFIVDREGYILTNEHVVLSGQNIKVSLSDGKTYPAKLVGAAPEADLALLKIDGATNLVPAELGNSDDLLIGETLIAVGNPFGLSKTVTVGVLSATGRSVYSGKRNYSDFIQTDAAINPGNSGGPLLNILGKVIGVNTAIIKNAQGIGFAIPINRAKKVLEQLKIYGKVKQIWLGILTADTNERYLKKLGIDYGVVVIKKFPFAFPESEEFEEGDVIQKINGKKVASVGDYNAIVSLLQNGSRVSLEVVREKGRKTITLNCSYLPDSLTPAMAWELLGLRVSGGRGGVYVESVRKNSPAQRVGLQKGDLILSVEDEKVSSEKEFLTKAKNAFVSTGLPITVARGNWSYYVTLNILEE
jgi:serine protease Do